MPVLYQTWKQLSPGKRVALLGLVVILLNLLLYSGSLRYGFYLDDHRLIANNPRITDIQSFLESWDELYFQFPDFPFLQYWRPFSLFTFFLNYQIGGLNPGGYHLLNIIINALGALFVFLIFHELTRRENFSLAVALAYSVHPAKVSAVCWISGRTDLLAALLVFMGVYFYQRFIRSGTPVSYCLMLLSFSLGLLSKEIVVLFPVFIAAMIIYYGLFPKGNRKSGWWKKQVLWWSPLLLIDGIYLVIHRSITGLGQGMLDIGFAELLISVRSLGAYLKLILAPFTPSPYFYMQDFELNTLLYITVGVVFLLFLLLLITRWNRYLPATLFAALFLLFLAPLLNLYIMPSYPKILPRFAMISSVFMGALYFELRTLLASAPLRRIYSVLLILLLGLMAVKVIQFQPYFQDDDTNIQRRMNSDFQDVPLLSQKAIYAMKRGNFQRALTYLDQAAQLDQEDPWIDNLDQIQNIRANILMLMGRTQRARQLIERLLKNTRRDDIRYYSRMMLAKIYEKEGELEKALEMLTTLDRYGERVILLRQKIILNARMGRFPQAMVLLDRLRELNPEPSDYRNLEEYVETLRQQSRDPRSR